jgi:hypothetical protein
VHAFYTCVLYMCVSFVYHAYIYVCVCVCTRAEGKSSGLNSSSKKVVVDWSVDLGDHVVQLSIGHFTQSSSPGACVCVNVCVCVCLYVCMCVRYVCIGVAHLVPTFIS